MYMVLCEGMLPPPLEGPGPPAEGPRRNHRRWARGGRGGGEEGRRNTGGHTEVLHKASTGNTKIATKAYQTKLQHTIQSPR